jgi:hypothetical protein
LNIQERVARLPTHDRMFGEFDNKVKMD